MLVERKVSEDGLGDLDLYENILTLVTRFFRLGMEEESSDETNLGGHVEPLATMLGVIFARNHARGKIPTSV